VHVQYAAVGMGSFGSVYVADYRGQEVAAKILNSQMNDKQIEEFKRYAASQSLILMNEALHESLTYTATARST
jgi:hypothetical protein